MILDFVKVLWLSFVIHALIAIAVCAVVFLLVRRLKLFAGAENIKPLKSALVLGLAISLLSATDLLMKNYQSGLISADFAAKAEAQKQAAAAANPMGLRADFMKAIDFLTSNPDQLTVQSKAKLFEQFSGLFPKGVEDLKVYYQQLKPAFQCQLALYEDALATYKTKKMVVSENSKTCEQIPGQFFNRERMMTPETLQANNALKEKILKPDPKDKPIKEQDLKSLVDQQAAKLQTFERIFQ